VSEPAPLRRAAQAVTVVASGILPPLVVLSTPILETPYSGLLLFLALLGSFALAYRWQLLRDTRFLGLWVAVALGIAVVSVLTGRWNGLTDEPYGTPAFTSLWPNLYGTPLHLVYYQYGAGPYSLTSYYVYLPFLTFLQVPGVDYRWVTVGAWVLTLWFVRKSGASVTLLAAPWVGLLAANGFNDFVALLMLTVTFVALSGWSSRLAEVVALGLKQFANVIIVAYHLWHRRWRDALLAVGVTAAILAPFAYLDPRGVWCHAILLGATGCSGSNGFYSATAAIGHLNYFLWPTWVLAIFGARYIASVQAPDAAPVRAEAAAALGELRPGASRSPPEALVLLATPYVLLRRAIEPTHPELWRVGKYLAVGASGVLVNLIVFTAARSELGTDEVRTLIASAIAFCVATAWNFVGNYTWTFRDRHSRSLIVHGFGFAVASVAALSVNLVVLYLLVPTVSASVAQFLGILAGTGFSFALNRGINFSRRGEATSS